MSYEKFMENAVSEWMKGNGPESEIIISSRIRLARNLNNYPFSILATESQFEEIIIEVANAIKDLETNKISNFEIIKMNNLSELQKKVLVEKHLISLNLANESSFGAVALSENESISIMINEEDHIRIQCLYPGLQIYDAWKIADRIDNIFENKLEYAFSESKGYLTSCPTNVGTGIRASVMLHLPALVLTGQINRIINAITQVGLTVRGIYGEGSDAIGNLFQISNQITLGQSEEDIIENLHGVVHQIIEHEKQARYLLIKDSKDQIEDRVNRALGILSHARIIDSKEATQKLSDLRLGIDLNMINGISANVLNELMVMTQPGFLQQYAKAELNPHERDLRRASIIRENINRRYEK